MKLLFITTRFPYPPIKGDQVVSYHRLRILSRRHQITLLSFYEHPDELKHIDALRDFCSFIHVIRRSKLESFLHMLLGLNGVAPLQVLYFQSARFQNKLFELSNEHHYDLVHGVLLRLAPYFESLKARKQPILLEIVDSMQLNLERSLILERGWKRLLWSEELRRMKKYEPRVVNALKPVTVVAKGDQDRIGDPDILVLPLGVDTEVFHPNVAPSQEAKFGSVIFSGNMGYAPNVQAAVWFVQFCFPIIKSRIPEFEFVIVGSSPTSTVRELAKIPGVTVTGFVESMPQALVSAQVSIAPMQSGSGMQFKILEAMASGRPVVTTTLGLGSIEATHGEEILVADSPETFSEYVINLIEDSGRAALIGKQARQFVEKHHSWVHSAERIENLYVEIINKKTTE